MTPARDGVEPLSEADLADCIEVARQDLAKLQAHGHGRTRIQANTLAALLHIAFLTRELQQAREREAFVVADGGSGGEHKYRCCREDGCGYGWTLDMNEALQFARRKDAEAFCREDEDAWLILPVPKGPSHD